MPDNPHVQGATIEGATGTIPVAKHPLRLLHVYEITEQDLATLNSVHFSRAVYTTLLGISASAAVSFIIVLLTVQIDKPKLYASFVAVVIVSCLVFLYSLAMWIRGEFQGSRLNRQLKGKETPAA